MSRALSTYIWCIVNTHKKIFYTIFSLFVMSMPIPCEAASTVAAHLPDGTFKVTIEGEIKDGDSKHFEYIVKFMENIENAYISSIHLNSPGGLIDEGLAIARYIRKRRFITVVENGHHCESICFFMLMYGNKKIIGRNAKIGIHGASRGGANAPESTWKLYEKEMQFFIPEYLGRGINGIPAREMYYLNTDDLAAMGFDCNVAVCKSDVLN